MPKNRRPRRNGGGARARSGQRRSESRRGIWIAGAVVVAAVGLVALGLSALATTGGGDFAFESYQGDGTLDSGEHQFSEVFAAGKPVVLNFWAGLCPPCRAEMPGFQRVYERHQDEIDLLGLDVGPFMGLGSNSDARTLLQELNVTYPAGRALGRSPVTQYGVASMPTTVFLTPDMEVFAVRQGLLSEDRMENLVQRLLEASAASS